MVDLKQIHKRIEQIAEQQLDKANWKRLILVWSIYLILLAINVSYTYALKGSNLTKIDQLRYQYDPELYLFDQNIGIFIFTFIFLLAIPISWGTVQLLFKKKVPIVRIAYGIGIGFVLYLPALVLAQLFYNFIPIIGPIFGIILNVSIPYFGLVLYKTIFKISYGNAIALHIVNGIFVSVILYGLFFGYAFLFSSISRAAERTSRANMLNHSDGSFTLTYKDTVIGIRTEICEIRFPVGWEVQPQNESRWQAYKDYQKFIKTSTKNRTPEEYIFFYNPENIIGGEYTEMCSRNNNFSIIFDNKSAKVCGNTEIRNDSVIFYDVYYKDINKLGYSIEYQSSYGRDQDLFYILNNTSCYTQWSDNSLLAKIFFR